MVQNSLAMRIGYSLRFGPTKWVTTRCKRGSSPPRPDVMDNEDIKFLTDLPIWGFIVAAFVFSPPSLSHHKKKAVFLSRFVGFFLYQYTAIYVLFFLSTSVEDECGWNVERRSFNCNHKIFHMVLSFSKGKFL